MSKYSAFRYVDNKKKQLLITFMGYHIPKPNREVPFTWNFLNKSEYMAKYDLLQLRDLRRTWYLRGVDHEDANNVRKLKEWLENYVKKYDQIYLIGSSMGGFAACLYGYLLFDAGYPVKVIAFAPQTNLSKGTGRYNLIMNNIKQFEKKKLQSLGVFSNLKDVVRKKFDLTIHIGKHNQHDIDHLELIKPFVKETRWYDTKEHQIAAMMKTKGTLYPYFEKLLL